MNLMYRPILVLVYFLYGLAFFGMGMIVALEGGRGSDKRLRHALRPLAVFGLVHGFHEWLEVFLLLNAMPFQDAGLLFWESVRIATLAFSFLSLSAFGASLLSANERIRRISLLLPLGQAALWGFSAFWLRGEFTMDTGLWDAADVLTRYIMGIPASLVASAGLINQQRVFRRAGMAQFGRDSLWAAIAFAWYGLVGQLFVRTSPLFPSTFLNQNLFLLIFNFPVQVLRAVAAGAAAAFVIRFLRASEVEKQRQIAELQASRVEAAEQREAMRGDLLRKVVAAQEAERQRIARELHDETGQALTALGLGLRSVSGSLHTNKDQAAADLRELEGLVSHSLAELQRLIADLRPSHLDDLGLVSAIKWFAGEIEERSDIKVKLRIEGKQRNLAGVVRTALFRIVQEALTNIVKHAGATRADVVLTFFPEMVNLVVTDNGCGFNTNMLSNGETTAWGLLGMRERATLLNGKFHIESIPGKQTRVEVTIPCPQNEEIHANANPAG